MWGATERKERGKEKERLWLFLLPSSPPSPLFSTSPPASLALHVPLLQTSLLPISPPPIPLSLHIYSLFFSGLRPEENQKTGGVWGGGVGFFFSPFMHQGVLGRQEASKSSKKSGATKLVGRQRERLFFYLYQFQIHRVSDPLSERTHFGCTLLQPAGFADTFAILTSVRKNIKIKSLNLRQPLFYESVI